MTSLGIVFVGRPGRVRACDYVELSSKGWQQDHLLSEIAVSSSAAAEARRHNVSCCTTKKRSCSIAERHCSIIAATTLGTVPASECWDVTLNHSSCGACTVLRPPSRRCCHRILNFSSLGTGEPSQTGSPICCFSQLPCGVLMHALKRLPLRSQIGCRHVRRSSLAWSARCREGSTAQWCTASDSGRIDERRWRILSAASAETTLFGMAKKKLVGKIATAPASSPPATRAATVQSRLGRGRGAVARVEARRPGSPRRSESMTIRVKRPGPVELMVGMPTHCSCAAAPGGRSESPVSSRSRLHTRGAGGCK